MAVVGDDTAPRVLASFNDYAGLISALRLRAEQRKISLSGEGIASVSGLPRGYAQRVLAPFSKSRSAVRRIGIISLGPLLSSLGVRLLLVEDPEAVERYTSRIPARQERSVRTGVVQISLSRHFLAKIGRNGGANSRKFIGKRKARAMARKAAAARWRPRDAPL